ncbi:hypothetical protein HETIRDRAFT_450748 [Heterobasidion irregulare TC 32-1]|uniref:WLM domain-containing protein n=1 Tax=Heterobasidion irregulare (strain TC 32-1) TaxID=747525 RepID=W4KCJ1_HETIT|nr:uncharacterized protein HETIRDRAFT_450748 [Heterobasidion irregulare TC 32-1]ETW83060.1 hypothetical protein HETIRDRAFT_450748 [Heterobasidion irregulare TC 32-1]
MVHHRINTSEPIPNPHINFITALPMPRPEDQERARQLLRALAAQVKPVMKTHGFVVNSLEEYEHNSVFAGRNWESGEVVELVLRRPDSTFQPTPWLMSTLCHELAHIKVGSRPLSVHPSIADTKSTKHMNHGPAFQALWSRLRTEVRALQQKGYYGDGYWSSGTRLADAARVQGDGLEAGDLPEYMVSKLLDLPGASRPISEPFCKFGANTAPGPSTHTGAQTARKRRAGTRVTTAGAFAGGGRALNADIGNEEDKKAGAGFRKQATSKRARAERALAAERRIQALKGHGKSITTIMRMAHLIAFLQSETPPPELEGDPEGSGSESDGTEELRETDQDRRRTMLDSMESSDLDGLKSGTLDDCWRDFILPKSTKPRTGPPPAEAEANLKGRQTATAGPSSLPDTDTRQGTPSKPSAARARSGAPAAKKRRGIGNIVLDEVEYRKKESLGLAATGNARTLGNAPHNPPSRSGGDPGCAGSNSDAVNGSRERNAESSLAWSCLVCTLDNEADHLACSACGTPKGTHHWEGDHA